MLLNVYAWREPATKSDIPTSGKVRNWHFSEVEGTSGKEP